MAQKKARARRDDELEPDRLSALPDCLLHTLMSSLKARQAVQTCVLSRRWRHLWRSVPCLDIDLDEFRADTMVAGNDSSDSDGGNSGTDHDSYDSDTDSYPWSTSDDDDDDTDKQNVWQRFEDFTVNLMIHCNIAQLDSFRLHFGREKAPRFGARQAEGWLRRAMKYGPCPPAPRREGSSSAPWLLKRLHLSYVRLDGLFAEHVSSVCLSLEDLELDSCTCEIQSITSHSLKTLVLKHCIWRYLSEITSPTLKTLVIDGGSNNIGHPRQLVILAPAAAYLHLNVRVLRFGGGISINEMPSLAKALIYLRDHRNLMAIPSSNLARNLFNLLCGVSRVTSLELFGAEKMVIGKESTFQEFKNLRNLVLDKCDLSDDFRTLGFFLQSSPYLEKLTLRQCQFPEYSKKKKGTPKLNKTSFSEFHGLDYVFENLTVEIIYKNGDAHLLKKLLLRSLENVPKSSVKLTKVK